MPIPDRNVEGVLMRVGFRKGCGQWEIYVGPPSPRWVTLSWDGNELRGDGYWPHIMLEDLRDLRYLIDRALAELEPTAK